MGLLVLFLVMLWALCAALITFLGFKMKGTSVRSRRFWGVLTLVFLAPFGEEIFIVTSFGAHCAVSSGVTSLTPVQTNAVTTSARGGWGFVRVLEHPSIHSVYLTGNKDEEIGPRNLWISKTKEPEKCKDPINGRLLNHSQPYMRVTPRRALKQGFCYSSDDMGPIPQVQLSAKWGIKHQNFSFLFPYPVTEDRFDIWFNDGSSNQLLSSYSALSANSGTVYRYLFRNAAAIRCGGARDEEGNKTFPFGNPRAEFLNDAIL